MTKEELYRSKGEITTQLEILQAKLRSVNDQLIKIINEENKTISNSNHTETVNN